MVKEVVSHARTQQLQVDHHIEKPKNQANPQKLAINTQRDEKITPQKLTTTERWFKGEKTSQLINSQTRKEVERLMSIKPGDPGSENYKFDSNVSKHPIDPQFLADLKMAVDRYENEIKNVGGGPLFNGEWIKHCASKIFCQLTGSRSLTQEALNHYESIATNLSAKDKTELDILEKPADYTFMVPERILKVNNYIYKVGGQEFEYSGEIRNGKPHGTGIQIGKGRDEQGSMRFVAKGEFADGDQLGGQKSIASAENFDENWELHGFGKIVYLDNRMITGKFEHGVPVPGQTSEYYSDR